MRRADDGLRALFHRYLPPPRHLTSLELGMTSRGAPDLHFCVEGVSGFVECKATSGWAVTLRPSQVGWLVTHARHGGRVIVAVRRRTPGGPRRGDPADELWLLRGGWARQLRAEGLRWALKRDALTTSPRSLMVSPVLGRWSGGPRRWAWDEVRALLCA